MGQQQVMLIVLGVIIAAIAVIVGIQIFSTTAEEDNIDQTSLELLRLVDQAQEYYAKPKQMGGGARAFTGFSIPAAMDTTENAYYTILYTLSQSMSMMGTCRTAQNATVTVVVRPKSHRLTVTQWRERPGC